MQEFACWIASLWKKFGVNLIAYHADFALFCHVYIVDFATIEQRDIHHHSIFGGNTYNVITIVEIAITHFHFSAETHRCNIICMLGCLANSGHIATMNSPRAPFLQALVGFTGAVWNHEARIGGKARQLGSYTTHKRLTNTSQHEQHHHTPKDTKTRQDTARAVLANRSPYFFKKIHII